jgi:hypothetical protein
MSKETLSILCADLTGSERLYEKLAPSEAAHAIGRCEKRIVQTLEGFHGRLARCSDSRVLAYFSDAEEALQSAVEIQRRVAGLPPLSGVALEIRVGVCVGHASNEMSFFENKVGNAAVSLSGFAEPGQVLMSVPSRTQGFEWNGVPARSRPEVSLSSGKRKLGVFEIDWRSFGTAHMKAAPANDEVERLFIHYNGTTTELNATHPLLSIGRLSSCGLILHRSSCSRVHAKIERRGDAYVLIDQSTNGTFVQTEGGEEEFVRKRELLLSGRGKISFGEPFSAAKDEGNNADWVHYVTTGAVAPSRF